MIVDQLSTFGHKKASYKEYFPSLIIVFIIKADLKFCSGSLTTIIKTPTSLWYDLIVSSEVYTSYHVNNVEY